MERMKVAKELKNAEKKRSRLKRKAKLLSDKDLLDVLHLRTIERSDKETSPPTEPAADPKETKVAE